MQVKLCRYTGFEDKTRGERLVDLARMPIEMDPPLNHDLLGATLFNRSLSCDGQRKG